MMTMTTVIMNEEDDDDVDDDDTLPMRLALADKESADFGCEDWVCSCTLCGCIPCISSILSITSMKK